MDHLVITITIGHDSLTIDTTEDGVPDTTITEGLLSDYAMSPGTALDPYEIKVNNYPPAACVHEDEYNDQICYPGDIDCNGVWNVSDVVILANCILDDDCDELTYACAADVNQSGVWNVSDIVPLANCILDDCCGAKYANDGSDPCPESEIHS